MDVGARKTGPIAFVEVTCHKDDTALNLSLDCWRLPHVAAVAEIPIPPATAQLGDAVRICLGLIATTTFRITSNMSDRGDGRPARAYLPHA